MWLRAPDERRDSVDPSPTEKYINRVKRPELNIKNYKEVPRTIGFEPPIKWTRTLWNKIVKTLKFS